MVPSIGSRRRLQALAAIGIGSTEIGQHLGITASAVGKIRTHTGLVMASTAARVATLYDQLWNQPRVLGPNAARTRTVARKAGWIGPLGWDDEDLDDPAARPRQRKPVRPVGDRVKEQAA